MQISKKRVLKFAGKNILQRDDDIVVEEPLTINVNGDKGYFCMRLPGMDRELAAGILYNEGIISSVEEIKSITAGESSVDVEITGASPVEVKSIYSSTGGMSSADMLRPPFAQSEFVITPEDIFFMKDLFLSKQEFFNRTGGTHCAGLFSIAGGLMAFAEDVGRHNALDKCAGSVLLAGSMGSAPVVMLSSRLSLEMIKKSCRTGALIVAGVSAPTSAAVEAAEASGITLIGFLREGRFNVYSCPQRISGFKA